jgi:hypothetical protein
LSFVLLIINNRRCWGDCSGEFRSLLNHLVFLRTFICSLKGIRRTFSWNLQRSWQLVDYSHPLAERNAIWSCLLV